ncbi:MAG: hypothetical protein QM537_06820 [Candidatus Symbiobacter sp.]|nr:hypothetical protein [Candidatus Symbiobacter sp.]
MSTTQMRQVSSKNLVSSFADTKQEEPQIILSKLPPPPPLTAWDSEAVAERLAEAFDTLNRLPLPPHAVPSQIRSSWPQMPENSPSRASTTSPTPSEITRMEQCLPEWMLAVKDILPRRALYLRLYRGKNKRGRMSESPLSTRAVGRILGVSHQTVKNWEEASLAQIAKELNQANLARSPGGRAAG